MEDNDQSKEEIKDDVEGAIVHGPEETKEEEALKEDANALEKTPEKETPEKETPKKEAPTKEEIKKEIQEKQRALNAISILYDRAVLAPIGLAFHQNSENEAVFLTDYVLSKK